MGSSENHIWLEEELQDGLKWMMAIKEIHHQGQSKFQKMELCSSVQFGKILLLDGKVQSAQADERVYHELLVQPAMMHHPNPKTVFICGGGEGSTAREVLKHKSVEKCVMVDIDKVVCDFCEKHLEENKEAFKDPRLELIYDDAQAQLVNYPGKFDVIIGDLADPLEGGPCYQMYTQTFYRDVILAKLNPGGVFATQSGAATITGSRTFTAINHTLASVFPKVVPYTQHVPSFCEEWGWNMCFVDGGQCKISGDEFQEQVEQRLDGKVHFLDGITWGRVSSLHKITRDALAAETHINQVDNVAFLYGKGINAAS